MLDGRSSAVPFQWSGTAWVAAIVGPMASTSRSCQSAHVV